MMPWFRVPTNIVRQPRTIRLARELNMPLRMAYGMVMELWSWAIEFSEDGTVDEFVSMADADTDEFRGSVEADALIEHGFLEKVEDGALKLVDWDFLTNANEKERQRQYYVNKKQQKVSEDSTEIQQNSTDFQQNLTKFNALDRDRDRDREKEKDKDKGKVPPKAEPAPVPFSEIMEKFNDICTSLPKVQKLTEARKTAIRRRWENDAKKDISWFVRLFEKVRESDFLSGRNGRSWRADFDWILEPRNVTRILEGNYDQDRQEQQPTPAPATWTTAATPNGNADHNSDQAERDETRRLLARNKRYEFLAKAGGVQL